MCKAAFGLFSWQDIVARNTSRNHSRIDLRHHGAAKGWIRPLVVFRGKDNDKRLVARLKKRYELQNDGRAYRIDSINDQSMCIGASILANKVVRKKHPTQCNSVFIVCEEQCEKCVQMNWSLFLMNQLAKDAVVVQTGDGHLHTIGC